MAPAHIMLTRALAFAGALPFVASALLLWSGERAFPGLGQVQTIAASYGLLILAFMAGIHWGQALSGVATNINLFITSNAIALAAWFAYLLLSPKLFFASLAALFAAILIIDRTLAAAGTLDRNYLVTRSVVSAIVVLSLAIIALKV
jgi:ATP/ADP translocase